MKRKRLKRRLRKPIRFALETVIGVAIVLAFVTALFMNASIQADRYNDPSYIEARMG